MATHGAFAEESCMHELGTFAIEEDTSFEMAASYQMAYGTSYHALMQRGELKKDDELLVLGASGGVGLASVDIAVAKGARVVAGVSNEEKAQICQTFSSIHYSTQRVYTLPKKPRLPCLR